MARGWGKPAVVGAEVLRLGDRTVTVDGVTLYEGDWVSIDGGAGIVVAGQVPLTSAAPPAAFDTVLSWADDIRKGHLNVRANADTGEDAANARSLGAEGIGLCRTEHMFLGEDRLPVVRRMILAQTPGEEADALEELRFVQREDFIELLAAMDGLPVTVRLLDPPLHEFLPSTEELALKDATVGLNPEERRLYEAALSWREANPMLGTRGVRLGVIKPGLYAMQVRALMEAARQRVADGGHPIVEIMIPLTVTREELALARGWVEDAVAEVNKERAPRPSKGAKAGTAKGGEARRDDRHDDRDAAGRAAGRRDRRGGRLLLLRHQRPDPDDVRLLTRRRRGPDDGRVPRARAAAAQPLRGGRRRRRRRAGPHRRPSAGGPPARGSRSASAASTAATRRRSTSSTGPGSTTSAARPTGCRWPAWPPPRRCWPGRRTTAAGDGSKKATQEGQGELISRRRGGRPATR